MIIILDSFYSYLEIGDPETWNLSNNGQQSFNSFAEVILAVLEIIDTGGGLI